MRIKIKQLKIINNNTQLSKKKMWQIPSYQIAILQGLFLVSWSKIQVLTFQNQHTIFIKQRILSLIIQSPHSLQPQFVQQTKMRVMECRWAEDLQKYSPIIIKSNIELLLKQLNNAIKSNKCIAICEDTLTSNSIMICSLILMTKYKWNLLLSLSFIKNKSSLPYFSYFEIQYLRQYEKYLHQKHPLSQINRSSIIVNQSMNKKHMYRTISEIENYINCSRKQSMVTPIHLKRDHCSLNKSARIFQNIPNNDETKFSSYHNKINNIVMKTHDDFQPQQTKIISYRTHRQNKHQSSEEINSPKFVKTDHSLDDILERNRNSGKKQGILSEGIQRKYHRYRKMGKKYKKMQQKMNQIYKIRSQLFRIYHEKIPLISQKKKQNINKKTKILH